jgi:hypothetical protein
MIQTIESSVGIWKEVKAAKQKLALRCWLARRQQPFVACATKKVSVFAPPFVNCLAAGGRGGWDPWGPGLLARTMTNKKKAHPGGWALLVVSQDDQAELNVEAPGACWPQGRKPAGSMRRT